MNTDFSPKLLSVPGPDMPLPVSHDLRKASIGKGGFRVFFSFFH